MLYGFTDSVLSICAGKLAGKFGRNLPFLVALFIDISNYVFCLTWKANETNSWLIYVLFLSFGISDGIWQTLITGAVCNKQRVTRFYSARRQLSLGLCPPAPSACNFQSKTSAFSSNSCLNTTSLFLCGF